MNESTAQGFCKPAFEPVRQQFNELLEDDAEFGAQFAVYFRGEPVVDLAGGPGVDGDAYYPVFSATKGASAMVIACLVEDGMLDLDERVVHYWPEFGAAGKSEVLVSQLLSHQAGLIGADGLTAAEILESVPAAARLAAARPLWRPGSAVGYHGLTIGVFMEELVRRVTGARLQDIYEERIRRPRNVEFYLGLPGSLQDKHVKARYGKPVSAADGGAEPLDLGDGPAAFAFATVHRPFMLNEGDLDPFSSEVRNSGFAAGGGAGSARGLAQLYSAALGDFGGPLWSADTTARMTQLQVVGEDLVLGMRTAFGTVFARPHSANPFGSYSAYGHDGAGGVVAYADPLYGLAVGFVPDPMELTPLRAHRLSRVVRECVLAAA
ncbi:serine hydrolase domain-containing protein [Pseudarthrobacter sp. NPDC089323]